MRISRNLRALLLATAIHLAVPACTSPEPLRLVAARIEIDQDAVDLPARWDGGVVRVDVEIDGGGHYVMVLDTGASALVVSPRVVAEAGLAVRPLDAGAGGQRVTGAQGTEVRHQEAARIGRVRAGALVLEDVEALVVDLSPMERALGHAVDGVLPATAFLDHVVILDFPARRVTVVRGSLDPSVTDHVVTFEPGPLPVLTLEIAGRPFECLVDSGSGLSLAVPDSMAADLPVRSPFAETGRVLTIGGPRPLRQARMEATVDLAGHAVASPVVTLTPSERGTLGLAILREFRFSLDLAGGKARFERAEVSPLTEPPVRSMGAGFWKSAREWEVAYVLDGSPAAGAGLRAGDRIVQIDGRPVGAFDAPTADALMKDAARMRLRMADGREIDVAVVTLVE